MIDILNLIGSLGVGAFLALIIFFMYRRDRNETLRKQREDRKFMEDRLTKLLEDDQQSREANTRTLTELTTLISRLNGRLK